MRLKRILAVATSHPFDGRTFSGLSVNLFNEVRRQGVELAAVCTRDIRWYDLLRGAVLFSNLMRGGSRKHSRINPDWYWSRRGHELMTRRFLSKLGYPPEVPVLQIGTHVKAARGDRKHFCVTDLTVKQALEAGGMYQVSRASPAVQREAIEWQSEVFQECERIFTLSKWAATSVVQDYGVPTDKVIVIGAGANLPRHLPARRRRVDSPSILFVGMDWEQKGGPLVLEAFRLVRRQVPRARLVVIGCRPPAGDDEPGVEALGRLDRSIPEHEKRLLDAYAEATCFCIAPAVDAFPNVLLEAAAFGLPIVSTDIGSRSEVVCDGMTGRLVPHGDHEQLADALMEILSNPGVAEAYGSAASARVREVFNWEKVVGTMLGHIAACLQCYGKFSDAA